MDLDALINSDGADSLKHRSPMVPEEQETVAKRNTAQCQPSQPPPQKIPKNEGSGRRYEEENQGSINRRAFPEIAPAKTDTQTFYQLVQPQEESYAGKKSLCVTLVLGRLASHARLFPDPTPIIEAERRAEPTSPFREFPRSLGIAGFLNAKTLPSPPSISTHRILPLPTLGSSSDAQQEGDREILGLMLSSVLFTHRLTAVVALGPEWRGIITAPALGKLVFHVLKPRIVLPGLGSLHSLATLSSLMLAGCTSFKEPEIPLEVATHNHRGKASGSDSAVAGEEEATTRIPFGRTPLFPDKNMLYASFAQFEKLTFSLPGSYNELTKIFDRVVSASKLFHESTNLLNLFYTFVQKCYSNAELRKQQGISLFKELYDESKRQQKSHAQKID